MNMNTKRWAVIRKSTGSVIRKFGIRDAARSYKRDFNGNVAILDTVRGVVVR